MTRNSHGRHGEPEGVEDRQGEKTRESERLLGLAVCERVCLPRVKAWSDEGGGAHQ